MEIFVFIGRLFELFVGIVRNMLAVVLFCVCVYLLGLALLVVIELAKRRYRRYKMETRIIRQAKAMGVWNTNAGGLALELYAKEHGLKRLAGESDAHLRQRIKEAAENGDPCYG